MTERPGPATEQRRGREAATSALDLELKRDAEAPATARAALHAWCPDLSGGAPRRETLVLLVSEVVTNAVLHSRGPAEAPIRVTASVADESVRVAVTDAGQGFTPEVRDSPRPPSPMRIGGYGLFVVNRAARQWGVDRVGGTRVWFEL